MKKLVLMLLMCVPFAAFAQTAPKFGHVNAQAIMQELPEFIKARGELEAQSKQYENDMKAMQDEIQRKGDEYEKNQSTMNATAKAEAEAALNQLMQKYQQAYQDNQQALQKAQQEKMQPIMDKVITAIRHVGKNGGYGFIMDGTIGITYSNDPLSKDVTADANDAMNKIKQRDTLAENPRDRQ